MADVHSKWINGQLVFWDTYEYRWVDAIGPDVVKYCNHFVNLPVDDTTGNPTEFTTTETGVNTVVISTTAGGRLLLTTGATENNGISMQLTGEAFKLESNKPLYFGTKLQVNDADQVDLFIGLCITDTDLAGGMTDGVYFESLDESASISCVTEKDSTETQTDSTGTLVDATDKTLEFYWDGSTYIHFYIDGTLVASSSTNIPTDEELTLSIELLTGEGTANTCSIDWVRVIQIR
ncbi:hypothetical protein C4571_02130 [Candidatus Parcubacteria bacterium]|nr:MAG: hypothetical protein C4571_02130 [Candidatus Parcubacteria bacterium]